MSTPGRAISSVSQQSAHLPPQHRGNIRPAAPLPQPSSNAFQANRGNFPGNNPDPLSRTQALPGGDFFPRGSNGWSPPFQQADPPPPPQETPGRVPREAPPPPWLRLQPRRPITEEEAMQERLEQAAVVAQARWRLRESTRPLDGTLLALTGAVGATTPPATTPLAPTATPTNPQQPRRPPQVSTIRNDSNNTNSDTIVGSTPPPTTTPQPTPMDPQQRRRPPQASTTFPDTAVTDPFGYPQSGSAALQQQPPRWQPTQQQQPANVASSEVRPDPRSQANIPSQQQLNVGWRGMGPYPPSQARFPSPPQQQQTDVRPSGMGSYQPSSAKLPLQPPQQQSNVGPSGIAPYPPSPAKWLVRPDGSVVPARLPANSTASNPPATELTQGGVAGQQTELRVPGQQIDVGGAGQRIDAGGARQRVGGYDNVVSRRGQALYTATSSSNTSNAGNSNNAGVVGYGSGSYPDGGQAAYGQASSNGSSTSSTNSRGDVDAVAYANGGYSNARKAMYQQASSSGGTSRDNGGVDTAYPDGGYSGNGNFNSGYWTGAETGGVPGQASNRREGEGRGDNPLAQRLAQVGEGISRWLRLGS